MRVLIALYLLFFSSAAYAADITNNDVSNFVKTHINATQSCNHTTLTNHLRKNFSPQYTETEIYDNTRETITISDLIAYTDEDFSDPSQPMAAEDCRLNLRLGQIKIKNGNAIFQTVEDDYEQRRLCVNLATINEDGQFQMIRATCKYTDL